MFKRIARFFERKPMWQVENRTLFAVERGQVRDPDGAELWLVAVKCTFDIEPDGSTRISAKQPPVLRLPEYLSAPGASSLRYESDLVLAKKTTDVLLHGHAYAPAGRPVTETDIDLKVGPVSKRLRVFGDRRWGYWGASAPQPFSIMPIVYERAYGGHDPRSAEPPRDWDDRNPIGTGFAATRANLDGALLPNFEYPDRLIRSWDDRPPPAGLGPIASHWQPRAALAGTFDDKWQRERQPLLPTDFALGFYQCAPLDQQTPQFLAGGEPVQLLNLTPSGEMKFKLPRVHLGFETLFYGGARKLHRTRHLHTVIIEPDYPRISLVWHTALPCHFQVHKLDRTIVTLKRNLDSRGLAPDDEADDADEVAS